MKRYEIRCTEPQTRKAMELGAPIQRERIGKCITVDIPRLTNNQEERESDYVLPTAEQMIGWLEEQGVQITSHASIFKDWSCFCYPEDTNLFFQGKWVDSRKEATLAAIDAALEYLTNKMK